MRGKGRRGEEKKEEGKDEREMEGERRREGAPIEMKSPNQNPKYATGS